MKEILCFAKYAVKRRQAFNQRFLRETPQHVFINGGLVFKQHDDFIVNKK